MSESSSPTIVWTRPMTSEQASKRFMTAGFVPLELYKAAIQETKKLAASRVKELEDHLEWVCTKCNHVFPREAIKKLKFNCMLCPKCDGILGPKTNPSVANELIERIEELENIAKSILHARIHGGKYAMYNEIDKLHKILKK